MESDPQARPDTILVTGSSGYLGYAVARRLSRRYAVVGLDRRAPSHPPPSAECLYVDLTSEASLARALDAVRDLHGDRVASVLHFAAYYDFSGAPSPLYERVTVQGTARLLRLLRERFTVEQFVFSSTMLVHAPTTPGRPITEASPLAPRWPYPQSKVRTEAAIRSGRGDVPAVLLRLAGVYDDLGHTLPLPRQIQRIYERLPEAFLFPGDLSHGQAMVHLHDVVDLYERLVAHRRTLPPEVTLLAGEPETLGYGELQRLIGRLVHGEAWATRPIPRWLARAAARWGPVAGLGTAAGITPAMVDLADDHYELDITHARTLLGWTPQRSLRETLPAITAALLADPWAWYRENELPMPPWLEETVPRPAAPPGPIAGISDEQVARIETMAIADASAQGPAHDDQGHGAAPSRSEHARRAEPRGHAHHAVHEGETGQEAHRVHALHPPAAVAPPPRRDDLEARLRRLDALRNFQSLLEVARRRELARQLARDDEAQRLMETDPRGHVAMMRPMQEDEALVRELPEEVLRQEAALYGEIVRLRGPQPPPRALPDPLMTGMVVGERWVHVTVLTLGAWLLAAPSALAYPRAALAWSDMTSGALVIALAALTLTGRRWAPWANALVGLWVMFAPLLFWTPSPAVYAVDTVVGALIVGLVVIVPMRTPMPGTDVPPGWSYNPSTWVQRLPIVALALASFFMARHMAAFQLGHLETAWDPIFGRGTARILTSEVSRAFPVSDAGLGAYTYMIEVLSGLMGDTRRWATMPWMVAMFGVAVVPLGIVSIVLVILQPVAVGAWCTLCLASAALMLVMAALSLDEIVAMVQFLRLGRRRGLSAWGLFWHGGTVPPRVEDRGLARPAGSWREMIWEALRPPWTLVASALLGVWVMAAPDVLGSTGTAADADRILGALAAVVAVTAMAEAGRPVRFLNLLLGAAVAVAPWVLPGASPLAGLHDGAAGVALMLLSLPRGSIRQRYGGAQRYLV